MEAKKQQMIFEQKVKEREKEYQDTLNHVIKQGELTQSILKILQKKQEKKRLASIEKIEINYFELTNKEEISKARTLKKEKDNNFNGLTSFQNSKYVEKNLERYQTKHQLIQQKKQEETKSRSNLLMQKRSQRGGPITSKSLDSILDLGGTLVDDDPLDDTTLSQFEDEISLYKKEGGEQWLRILNEKKKEIISQQKERKLKHEKSMGILHKLFELKRVKTQILVEMVNTSSRSTTYRYLQFNDKKFNIVLELDCYSHKITRKLNLINLAKIVVSNTAEKFVFALYFDDSSHSNSMTEIVYGIQNMKEMEYIVELFRIIADRNVTSNCFFCHQKRSSREYPETYNLELSDYYFNLEGQILDPKEQFQMEIQNQNEKENFFSLDGEDSRSRSGETEPHSESLSTEKHDNIESKKSGDEQTANKRHSSEMSNLTTSKDVSENSEIEDSSVNITKKLHAVNLAGKKVLERMNSVKFYNKNFLSPEKQKPNQTENSNQNENLDRILSGNQGNTLLNQNQKPDGLLLFGVQYENNYLEKDNFEKSSKASNNINLNNLTQPETPKEQHIMETRQRSIDSKLILANLNQEVNETSLTIPNSAFEFLQAQYFIEKIEKEFALATLHTFFIKPNERLLDASECYLIITNLNIYIFSIRPKKEKDDFSLILADKLDQIESIHIGFQHQFFSINMKKNDSSSFFIFLTRDQQLTQQFFGILEKNSPENIASFFNIKYNPSIFTSTFASIIKSRNSKLDLSTLEEEDLLYFLAEQTTKKTVPISLVIYKQFLFLFQVDIYKFCISQQKAINTDILKLQDTLKFTNSTRVILFGNDPKKITIQFSKSKEIILNFKSSKERKRLFAYIQNFIQKDLISTFSVLFI
ncbi:hypothetical protein M0811_12702 [Anaeramoeba ignava]|uniref:PLEKHM2 PH domain-containing protein n=1 Tax=Anaeramoeba ignava TaxID=1746090 RepID=A0A9Q0L7Y0_ANAIG|nr:hypothetical protein M0811_12702 [Anaeramoeba ignava]